MPDEAIRHERRDVSLRPVLRAAVGFTALVIGAATVLYLVYSHPTPVAPGPRRGETPLLQGDPAAELAAFEASQRAKRDALRWVDREAGLARIPMADAMRIIAERGLPGRRPAPDCGTAVPRAPQLDCAELAQ